VESWLTVVIIVLIAAIVLDGFRRMRIAKRESIRLSKSAQKADRETDVAVSTSEFPSGGARVAGYRGQEDANNLNHMVRKSYETGRPTVGAPQRIPEQVSLNLEESVPMLMDSVGDIDEVEDEFIEPLEPEIGSLEDLQESVVVSEATLTPDLAREENGENRLEPVPPQSEEETTQTDLCEPDEVLVMNIMAKSGQRFAGSDLLQALMGEGMKFGHMDIFHRHKDNDGDAPIIYSLANMVVPGTFNLAEINGFETPGVSAFLSLPTAGDSLAAYDDMAKMARNLATKLDGELKDENRSVMTSQTVEHGRQRVIEYERKKKLEPVSDH